jgi:hypothetical protein
MNKRRRFTRGEIKIIARALGGRASDCEWNLLAQVGAAVRLPRLGWRVTLPARDQFFRSPTTGTASSGA